MKLSIFNRYLLRGQIECGAGDGLFKNGELLTLCPSCRIYCHLDCLLAYGNKCLRCFYQFEDDSSTAINSDITRDDKIWVLLAYIFSPLIPPILMIMEDKKDRPFIKAHNVQALIVGLIAFALSGFCVWPLIWLYQIYLGFQAVQGKYIEIPVITNFCKNQGWA